MSVAQPLSAVTLVRRRSRCRTLLLSGDFFLGGVIAASLAKLVLRLRELGMAGRPLNKVTAEVMLLAASILGLGEAKALTHPIDDDSVSRIVTALRVRERRPPVRSLALPGPQSVLGDER